PHDESKTRGGRNRGRGGAGSRRGGRRVRLSRGRTGPRRARGDGSGPSVRGSRSRGASGRARTPAARAIGLLAAPIQGLFLRASMITAHSSRRGGSSSATDGTAGAATDVKQGIRVI